MKRAAKKDINHNDIKEALQKIGAYVHDTHQLKDAFDCIVFFRGQSFVIEIKNSSYLPNYYTDLSKQEKRKYLEGILSDGEKKCMDRVQKTGVTYHILSTVEEALNLVAPDRLTTINQKIKRK